MMYPALIFFSGSYYRRVSPVKLSPSPYCTVIFVECLPSSLPLWAITTMVRTSCSRSLGLPKSSVLDRNRILAEGRPCICRHNGTMFRRRWRPNVFCLCSIEGYNSCPYHCRFFFSWPEALCHSARFYQYFGILATTPFCLWNHRTRQGGWRANYSCMVSSFAA